MSGQTSGRTTLFRGGVVLTGDPAAPRARALAVRDGLVVALDDDALALAGGGEVDQHDLAGGALLPGFGDAHAHPCHGGIELLEAPVRDCTTVEEVQAVVAAYAAANPDREWILGGSYDPSLAPSGLFDARWLDAVVPDRPVALTASDHHTLWVNSEALRRAGVTRETPDPPASSIPKREDGEPLGTLVEWAAMDLVRDRIPARSDREEMTGLLEALRLFALEGITWVQDAITTPADVDRLLRLSDELSEEGGLPVRVAMALRAEPGQWREQRPQFDELRRSVEGHPQLAARTVKLFADGVIEAGTAALLEPYADAPHTCGLPVWTRQELVDVVTAFDADGFQVHIHGIGDAGIRNALDAIEHAAQVNGLRDRRPVIAHTQLVHPDDLPRFAALGVVANFSPLWACLDDCQTQLTEPRLGAERAARQYPMATLLASGAVLSFGSDWPVSSFRPLDGLAVAVTRQTPDGRPDGGWLPHERIPVGAALSAYTQGPAYQAFEEHLRGTLTVGRRADLVHLSGDPTSVAAQDWPGLRVLGTWLSGRRTA